MPIFQYICAACGDTSEHLVLPGESDIAVCSCGCVKDKVLSPSNFKIKGYSYANGYSGKDTNVKA